MKKYIALSSLGFYALSFLLFTFAGAYIAGLLGAGKHQGLAAGAIVLGWGILVGFIAFVLAIIVVSFLKPKLIVKINWVLLALAISFFLFLRLKSDFKKQAGEKNIPQSELKTTEPTAMALFVPPRAANNHAETNPEPKPLGIGFFKPHMAEGTSLYFYGSPNLEKSRLEHQPNDSVVFAIDHYHNLTTSYAPPWLLPEYLKLDYGVMFFKVWGVGEDFLKVEANRINEQITYVDKQQGTYFSWPEFLLTMNSVEFISPETSSVYLKPLDTSSKINIYFSYMRPLLIEDNWMYVNLLDREFRSIGKGWIPWKKNGQLLIRHSLFS